MSDDQTVPAALRRQVVSEWRQANKTKAKMDFKLGCTAAKVRAYHGTDPSGDYQSRRWFMENLNVGITAARRLVEAAKASETFTEEDWEILGGWEVVQFIMHLPSRAAPKMLREAREYFTETGRAFSYHTAHKRALELDYRSTRKGRPMRSETEEKVNRLRVWLDRLYADFTNLPEMPDEVKDAMNGSRTCGPSI